MTAIQHGTEESAMTQVTTDPDEATRLSEAAWDEREKAAQEAVDAGVSPYKLREEGLVIGALAEVLREKKFEED